MDIKGEDLLIPGEREFYGNQGRYAETVASVKLPSYWSRLLLGKFQDLYILSPDTERTDDSPYASDGESEWSAEESSSAGLGVAAEQNGKARLRRGVVTALKESNSLERRIIVQSSANESGGLSPEAGGLDELGAPGPSRLPRAVNLPPPRTR